MYQVFAAVLPLFIIIGLGAVLKSFKIANDTWVEVLNKFQLYVGFPALILYNVTTFENSSVVDWYLIFYNFLFLAAIIVASYVFCAIFRLEKSVRNAYLVCIFFGNVAYLGMPFIGALIKDSENSVALHVALYVFALFTLGIFMLERSKEKKKSLGLVFRDIFKSPLLISALLALVFFLFQIKFPQILLKPLQLLAGTASPLALFSLGIFICRKIDFDRDFFHALLLALLKLIMVPVGIFLFANFFHLRADFHMFVYEAAMPIAVTAFALSEIYPLDKKIVSTAIFLSTVLAIFTLPLFVFLLTKPF